MALAQHRIVIVGAGLAGATTAWHLRQRGVADVLILERETVPGFHASGRNAAMLRETMEEAALQPLAARSATELRRGTLADFRPCGSLLMGLGDDDASQWIPLARGRGRFCPQDGVVDVAALLTGFLRGTPVRYGCELLAYGPDGDALRLQTSAGPVRAEVLVNAAGAWAGGLGDLPLTPTNRTLFVSAPDPRVDPGWPFLWDLRKGYYLRPESGGLLYSACDETPARPGDYTEDPAVWVDLAEKLQRHQPALGEPRIAYRWVGQRTFAGDRLPVIGFDDREPRLFHVAALGGHGVTLSHAVGELAANLLLGRTEAPADLAPGRLLRAS